MLPTRSRLSADSPLGCGAGVGRGRGFRKECRRQVSSISASGKYTQSLISYEYVNCSLWFWRNKITIITTIFFSKAYLPMFSRAFCTKEKLQALPQKRRLGVAYISVYMRSFQVSTDLVLTFYSSAHFTYQRMCYNLQPGRPAGNGLPETRAQTHACSQCSQCLLNSLILNCRNHTNEKPYACKQCIRWLNVSFSATYKSHCWLGSEVKIHYPRGGGVNVT
jgi:hypothetical protein